MHAIFVHAMRWEFFSRNPIALVRQSAKRVPDVLTIEEVGKLLLELRKPWRTAIYVAVSTGLRVSELLALRWSDVSFTAGQIYLSRGMVRQHVGEMKTEASRKPVGRGTCCRACPLAREGPLQKGWGLHFASPHKDGTQLYWPNAAMEDHIRPAALRAGLQKRVGWHTFRHTFGTLVNSEGADVATTQALLRHANFSITMDRYVQSVTPAKREAQSRLVQAIPFPEVTPEQSLFPNVPTRLTETAATD
jgi:integrase